MFVQTEINHDHLDGASVSCLHCKVSFFFCLHPVSSKRVISLDHIQRRRELSSTSWRKEYQGIFRIYEKPYIPIVK